MKWVDLGQLQAVEMAIPTPKPGEVLIRIKAVGVCSTDLHVFHYGHPGINPGIVLGHELAGDVAELGEGVTTLSVGDRVAVEPSLPCGECDMCCQGRLNLCCNFRHLGWQVNGGYAEFLAVPARNAYRLPDTVPYEMGALVEPMACCLHAMERLKPQIGDTAAIIGDGFFGLLFLQVLRLAGVGKVVVMGHHENRLVLAQDLGADLVVDTHQTDPVTPVVELAGPRGVDVCLEVAGSDSAVDLAIRLVRPAGRILLFSAYGGSVRADLNAVVAKELEIVAANASPNVWPRAIGLICQGVLKLSPLVTHRFSLSELVTAFNMNQRKDQAIKVIVYP